MRKIFFLIIFAPFMLKAQDNNKLSFDFGYSINRYKMDSLNKNYIDSFAKPLKIVDSKVKNGKTFFLNIKYQPAKLLDLGLFVNYQFGKENSNPEYVETDIYGNPNIIHKGNFEIKTEAISFGIVNDWYINELLKFKDKKNKFLQNSKLSTELNFGYGFSKLSMNCIYPSYKLMSFYNFYTATGYQGKIAIKYEYEYLNNPIIGSIGVNIGYQYFVTDKLRDEYNGEWKVKNSEAINLDFSGFYYSIYITFGK